MATAPHGSPGAGDGRRSPSAPAITSRSWKQPSEHQLQGMGSDVVLDLGWGRLVFGQTFADLRGIVDALRAEEAGERDICIYPRDPHVLVGLAPDELFIDPSYTYRLDLHRYRPRAELIRGRLRAHGDLRRPRWTAINDIYARQRHGASATPTSCGATTAPARFTYLVAEDRRTGTIVGTVTGVDHELAFGDPEAGTSLWCLAVHAQDAPPGTGEALVRVLAERYVGRGRAYLDLSVMHDNEAAIRLYRQARLHPGRRGLRQAQEPDQHAAVRRPAAGTGGPQPLRADHRRGGAAPRDPGGGDRRRVRRAAALGRRPDRHHPRVAVGVHHRRGDEPLRRQAGDPPVHGTGRGPGRPGRAARSRTTRARPPPCSSEVGSVVVKPARGEQGRGHHGGRPGRRRAWSGRSPSPRSSAPTSWSRSSSRATTCG